LTTMLARGREKGQRPKGKVENEDGGDRPPVFLLSPLAVGLSLAWLLAVEIGVECWYRVHERNLVARVSWNVRPPENVAGLRELKIDENVRQTLRFDTGREVSWKTAAGASDSTTNYLYFFRWNPGSSSVIRARAHRPDICLPSAGWQQTSDRGIANYLVDENFSIPFRH